MKSVLLGLLVLFGTLLNTRIDHFTFVYGFLDALVSGNEAELRGIVNNDSILDEEAISWLIGQDNVHPGDKPDLLSARNVLVNQDVRTKIIATEQQDGTSIVEVIYLPEGTAANFVDLAILVKSGHAKNFRDYMMCEFVVKGGRVFMRNICFADTGVFNQ